MTVEQHQHSASAEILTVSQGFRAGLAAALVMALVAMILAAMNGQGFWTPLNAIGGLFKGGGIVTGFSLGIALPGLVIHLLMGGGLGALYASAQERIDNRSLLVVALYYGLVVWVIATFAVLSWLKPSLLEVMRTWPLLAAHLSFGAVLGLFAMSRH